MVIIMKLNELLEFNESFAPPSNMQQTTQTSTDSASIRISLITPRIFGGEPVYQKKRLPIGYVRAADLYPVGTKVEVRMASCTVGAYSPWNW